MMTNALRCAALAAGLITVSALNSGASAQVYDTFKTEPLPMIQRSVLNDPADQTGVPEGQMGGIAYDPLTQCMYFTAPRSGVLIVLDPGGMSRLQVVRDLGEPMNVAVAPELRKLMLTCGDGSVKIFKIEANSAEAVPGKPDAGKVTFEKVVKNPGEADAIRYDSKTKKAFYAHGKFVSFVDPVSGEKCAKSLEMPGPARGIYLEQDGPRMFVGVPSKNQVIVVDRVKWEVQPDAGATKKSAASLNDSAAKLEKEAAEMRDKAAKLEKDAAELRTSAAKAEPEVKAEAEVIPRQAWELKDASPFALTADEKGGRLFVASRNPDKLLVLDMKDGMELDRLAIGGGAGDCWWDAIGQRVYVSCGGGGGEVSMVWLKDGKFITEHHVDTAPGARTSVLMPERRRYIVCAPKLDQFSFVYIYVLPNANEHHEQGPKSH